MDSSGLRGSFWAKLQNTAGPSDFGRGWALGLFAAGDPGSSGASGCCMFLQMVSLKWVIKHEKKHLWSAPAVFGSGWCTKFQVDSRCMWKKTRQSYETLRTKGVPTGVPDTSPELERSSVTISITLHPQTGDGYRSAPRQFFELSRSTPSHPSADGNTPHHLPESRSISDDPEFSVASFSAWWVRATPLKNRKVNWDD